MSTFGSRIQIKQEKPMNASTDMGNVSHLVPSFHGGFIIPAGPEISAHNPGFAACAGTEEAHQAALTCAKGMAMLALRILVNDDLAQRAKADFEKRDE